MTGIPGLRDAFFDVGEVRLHAVVGEPDPGSSRGTIVMLHGFPEFWYCWKHQLRAFARDFRVVAPDLRGYNLSDKPSGIESYKMPHLVGDVRGLIDALGEERVILMAHDWGGAVAWAFAASHADRLSHLVILNSPHPSLFMRDMVLVPEQQQASQYIHQLRSADGEAALARDHYAHLKRTIFGTRSNPADIDPEDERRYLEAWSRPGALTGMLNYYRAMPVPPPRLEAGAPPPPLDRAALDRIPKIMIRVPTLIVWGMRDHALRPSLLEGLDEFIADLEIVRLPEATHWTPSEAPGDVNRAVRDYLSRRL